MGRLRGGELTGSGRSKPRPGRFSLDIWL